MRSSTDNLSIEKKMPMIFFFLDLTKILKNQVIRTVPNISTVTVSNYLIILKKLCLFLSELLI